MGVVQLTNNVMAAAGRAAGVDLSMLPQRGRCKGGAWYAPVTVCAARLVEGWLVLCVGTRALQWCCS